MKTYLTIKELPQVKINTFVKFDGINWYFDLPVKKICLYNPNDEPLFFKEFKGYLFKKGDEVYVIATRTNNTKNFSFKNPATIVDFVIFKNTIKYTLNQNNFNYYFYEKDLYKAEKYFFINSKAEIHHIALTKTHEESLVYIYRKLTNNVYKTYDEARKFLNNVLIQKNIIVE